MAHYKTQRHRRYKALRAKHLVPIEAREFSKMSVNAYNSSTGRSAPNPTIAKIIQERGYLWSAFRVEATAKGWGVGRREREWKQRIVNLYSSPELKRGRLSNWLASKDIHGNELDHPTISPWEYYDTLRIVYDLMAWDSPRTHRKAQAVVSVDRIHTARWIHDLNKSIETTIDPARKAQLTKQRQNLRVSLRRTA